MSKGIIKLESSSEIQDQHNKNEELIDIIFNKHRIASFLLIVIVSVIIILVASNFLMHFKFLDKRYQIQSNNIYEHNHLQIYGESINIDRLIKQKKRLELNLQSTVISKKIDKAIQLSNLGAQIQIKEDNDKIQILTPQSFETQFTNLQQNNEDNSTLKMQRHIQRSTSFQIFSQDKNMASLRLAKYNLGQEKQRQIQESFLIQNYQLLKYTYQLSFCLIIHSQISQGVVKLNDYEYAINSALNQQYKNFKVVFVADGYNRSRLQKVKFFIKNHPRHKKVQLIWFSMPKGELASILQATKLNCRGKKIIGLLSGKDQLLGNQVFKLFNAAYQKYSANVVYSNYFEYHQLQKQIKAGIATSYTLQQKQGILYRSVGQKFGNFKTFRLKLLKYIHDKDLKDSIGQYYKYAADYALIYPLLQLSCEKIVYLSEYNYLYFGYETDPAHREDQINQGRRIRQRMRYKCYQKYQKLL